MLVLQALLFAALSVTALAKKAQTSAFEVYSKKSSPITLDERQYAELTTGTRDYHAAVVLTALAPQFACSICREFDPEWSILAKSWSRADKKNDHRMVFGTLDFEKGRNVFVSMQLQTAPVLLLFPPTVGANASASTDPVRFDFLSPQSAEGVNTWLVRHLPPDTYPEVYRPFDYAKLATTITLVVGVFTLATFLYPYAMPVIQNRNLWAALSLIVVLMFTSGHMFNHIRKVPYISGNGKGGITYFAGGFGNQYGIETQIIAAIYAVLSFAVIALALKVPRMKDSRTQQVATLVWAGVIFGMYSFLMSLFRIKNGGYPFWLPPF